MFFLTALNAGKFKIKVLADSVLDEVRVLFLACRQPPSPVTALKNMPLVTFLQ
jgi:hypothetical protein